MKQKISKEYLNQHPEYIFVLDGNAQHIPEYEGINRKNAFLFITKESTDSFFTLSKYKEIFEKELTRLEKSIISNDNKEFFITRLASGHSEELFEKLIYPACVELEKKYNNVNLLF